MAMKHSRNEICNPLNLISDLSRDRIRGIISRPIHTIWENCATTSSTQHHRCVLCAKLSDACVVLLALSSPYFLGTIIY